MVCSQPQAHDDGVQISARGEYAVRAALELAVAYPATLSVQELADVQQLPRKFLETILSDLRRGDVVQSIRGSEGGYRLMRPPHEMSVAAVLRAVDGPLATVRGHRPEQTHYTGSSEHLPTLWVAVRAAVRNVLDEISLSQLATGDLPVLVRELSAIPDAWQAR
jgi:Rrf2 family protein